MKTEILLKCRQSTGVSIVILSFFYGYYTHEDETMVVLFIYNGNNWDDELFVT